jgi:hypothetical protein
MQSMGKRKPGFGPPIEFVKFVKFVWAVLDVSFESVAYSY